METYLSEASRVDEPQVAKDYSEVLSRVASDHQPVIVCRNGQDLAAVIPLEHLEVLQDALARQDAEKLASRIDWDRLVKQHPAAPQWFEGNEPKPFWSSEVKEMAAESSRVDEVTFNLENLSRRQNGNLCLLVFLHGAMLKI